MINRRNGGDFFQPLSFDMSSVTDTSYMFADAHTFNHDLTEWDVSSVTDMSRMFDGAKGFAQTLCKDAWIGSPAQKQNMFNDSPGSICTSWIIPLACVIVLAIGVVVAVVLIKNHYKNAEDEDVTCSCGNLH